GALARVAGIDDPSAIGRPAAKLMDHSERAGDRDQARAILLQQVELQPLVTAGIHLEQQAITDGSIVRAGYPLGAVGSLMGPATDGWDTPHLRYTGNIGQKGNGLSIGGEGDAAGRANLQILGKGAVAHKASNRASSFRA